VVDKINAVAGVNLWRQVMTENDGYSERYKIEPCQIVIPGVPLIAESEDFSDSEQIRIVGFRTLETSAERALLLADEMLRPVRQDLRNGRCKELLKLRETRPEFNDHPWVQEEVRKWDRTGRSFTKRGRGIGSFETHPLVTVAAVDELVVRQWASKRHPAFAWLAEHGWLEYETAKSQYYQALREQRFRAVLLQNSIWSTPRPRLKARRLIRRADQLQPGQSITRTLFESPSGPVTVTLTAT